MNALPTVYVVDDDPGIRKAIAALLQSVRLPIQCFASAQEFLEGYKSGSPGCLVLDLRLPDLSGRELQQQMNSEGTGLPIVFITGHAEVATAVQAMKEGAVDFIEKPFSHQRLLDAVQRAIRVSETWLKCAGRMARMEERLAQLTAGEREVLELLAVGESYKSIASELDLSYKTVEARRARIMKKMGVDHLPQLISLLIAYRQDQNSRRRSLALGPASVE